MGMHCGKIKVVSTNIVEFFPLRFVYVQRGEVGLFFGVYGTNVLIPILVFSFAN